MDVPPETLITGEDLAALVPRAAANALLLGAQREGLVSNLAKRPTKLIQAPLPLSVSIPEKAFDCVVVEAAAPAELDSLLAAVVPAVTRHGSLCVLLMVQTDTIASCSRFFQSLANHGLLPLKSLSRESEGATEMALLLVRDSYDPFAYAHELEQAGLPIRALMVLSSVEEFADLTPEQRGLVAGEKHHLLHKVILSFPPGEEHRAYLSHARKEFQIAVHAHPRLHFIYREHAELWRHFGNDALAARLLRSVNHAAPDPETTAMLATLHPESAPQPAVETAPEWTGNRRPPRILVITHDHSDYGMDSLYDGLCIVLGKDNVVEFPWKGALHGATPEAALNYPCVFDYPGEPFAPEDLEQQLRDGRFDLILFADVVQFAYRDIVRRFIDAAPDVPLVAYDPWDDSHNLLPSVLEYLGRPTVAAHFKREMLAGLDYGPNAFPLPFGYPDRLVPADVASPRTDDLFWAGKRLFGARVLYLDHLSALLGRKLDRTYTQDEYRQAIRRARMGLCLFGNGYDTVRYWELPAHGVMLFAERPPIRIPGNFVDGESAVFFDDLPELESKLAHYLARPGEVHAIAHAGHAHFKRHHTTSARARQFLGRLEEVIAW